MREEQTVHDLPKDDPRHPEHPRQLEQRPEASVGRVLEAIFSGCLFAALFFILLSIVRAVGIDPDRLSLAVQLTVVTGLMIASIVLARIVFNRLGVLEGTYDEKIEMKIIRKNCDDGEVDRFLRV
ncbi:hypothetical protein [Bradyrhizobium sp.]|jgi:hypothetical protein|uniref:hypothetical protein n=1 Tax=Bradyrhizobium sp. TaxID=376 RepID=UPI003BB11FBE